MRRQSPLTCISAAIPAAALAMALALTGGRALAQDELPEIRLTFSDLGPTASQSGVALAAYAKAVTERSKGKITFEIYPSSSLLAAAEAAEGVASGTADLALTLTSYTPALFPVANWELALASLASGGMPFSAAYGAFAQTEWSRSNPEYLAEMAERNLHVVGGIVGYFDLLCNKPVRNLADARGKRTRVAGQVWAAEAEALGMTSVPIVPAEMFEAFSRGILDCIVLHPAGYQDFGLLDVPGKKYYIPLQFNPGNTGLVLANKAKWDSLPEAARTILTEEFVAYLEAILEVLADRHKSFAEIIQSKDVEMIEPEADISTALATVQKKLLDDLVATAPPAVADPAKFIADYTALVAKWRGIATDLGYAPPSTSMADLLSNYARDVDFGALAARGREEFGKLAQ